MSFYAYELTRKYADIFGENWEAYLALDGHKSESGFIKFLVNVKKMSTAKPKEESRVTRGRISCCAHNGSTVLLGSLLLCLTTWLSLSAGCSSVPWSVAALVTGEAPTDQTYAGRQHLPVTPDEAVECLSNVAPQQGWAVVNTGEEYDTQGQRGAFFRLATTTPGGSKQTVSGVFYAEPSGSYVRISEQNGLPETLVEPLVAEIKKKKGYSPSH